MLLLTMFAPVTVSLPVWAEVHVAHAATVSRVVPVPLVEPGSAHDIGAAVSLDTTCLRSAYGDNAAAIPLFNDAVVLQSMAMPYPLEPHRPTPQAGEHPGRVRSYALLGALYGHTKAEVEAQLETVQFMGQSIRLSAVSAAAFRRVVQRLTALALEKPQLKTYMLPVYGFVWRTIASETRLSPHSYGIAVDINPNKGPYWLWVEPAARPAQSAKARGTYPMEIVSAFEAEGFIWGGKWYEYDMMHFEYRPELICKATAQHAPVPTPVLVD